MPNLIKLANLALIMPYQTADCERGFSCQNAIKCSKRNRLKADRDVTSNRLLVDGGNYGEKLSAVLWADYSHRLV